MHKKSGKVLSINISAKKGIPKTQVPSANVIENFGIEGDAHSGNTMRQISLLAWESISRQEECPKAAKKGIKFKPGDFAENITTQGLNLSEIKKGDLFTINDIITLEVSQIGKVCHNYCEIFKKLGSCIMPKEGIFTKVIRGGKIITGDPIIINSEVQ